MCVLVCFRPAASFTTQRDIANTWVQAVYGRIEGMYTRSQLMSSLAEQKEHTKRLVGRVDELAGGLGDMEVRGAVLERLRCSYPVSDGRILRLTPCWFVLEKSPVNSQLVKRKYR